MDDDSPNNLTPLQREIDLRIEGLVLAVAEQEYEGAAAYDRELKALGVDLRFTGQEWVALPYAKRETDEPVPAIEVLLQRLAKEAT